MQQTIDEFIARLKTNTNDIRIEDVHQLEGSTKNMIALQIKYPELSEQIETLKHYGYNIFEEGTSHFIVGTVFEEDKQYSFVNFITYRDSNLTNGKNIIFIPGQGMQEYNIGDYSGDYKATETFVHKVGGIELFREFSENIGSSRVRYTQKFPNENGSNRLDIIFGKHGSAKYWDKDNEFHLENNYPNRLQKQVSLTRFNQVGNYDDKGSEAYEVQYGYLYRDIQDKLPIRIYKKENGNRTVYELDSITNKYRIIHFRNTEEGLNISDPFVDVAPISFEEFEQGMIEKHGIIGVTNSELEKCFFSPETYPIPTVIREITKSTGMVDNLESRKI